MNAKILQFPTQPAARPAVQAAPAPRVSTRCETCGEFVPPDAEGTLAHLIACEAGDTGPLERDEAIKRIKTALRNRSGKTWSVTGGRGTAWGWIHISAPPKRLVGHGYMTEADAAELGKLLGTDSAHSQGVSIAADGHYRHEYVARAEGREPTVIGVPYWD
jgi:hypothetical protein